MKARSCKNKGNRFENYLVERLKEIDPETKRSYASGAGLDKGDIRVPIYDFNVEAKNAKTVSLVKDFKQAEDQCVSGGTAVLMIRNPKKKEFDQTFVVMDLEDFLVLLDEKTKYEAESSLTSQDKWKLKRLKDACHEVMKTL